MSYQASAGTPCLSHREVAPGMQINIKSLHAAGLQCSLGGHKSGAEVFMLLHEGSQTDERRLPCVEGVGSHVFMHPRLFGLDARVGHLATPHFQLTFDECSEGRHIGGRRLRAGCDDALPDVGLCQNLLQRG